MFGLTLFQTHSKFLFPAKCDLTDNSLKNSDNYFDKLIYYVYYECGRKLCAHTAQSRPC